MNGLRNSSKADVWSVEEPQKEFSQETFVTLRIPAIHAIEIIVDLHRFEHRVHEFLPLRIRKSKVNVKKAPEVAFGVELLSVQHSDGMCQLGTVDG